MDKKITFTTGERTKTTKLNGGTLILSEHEYNDELIAAAKSIKNNVKTFIELLSKDAINNESIINRTIKSTSDDSKIRVFKMNEKYMFFIDDYLIVETTGSEDKTESDGIINDLPF